MTGPVPIRLEAALLRTTMPDLVLREGMVLAARVLERSGHRGLLSMAGRQIAAELPDTLAPGAEVRLRVQEAGPERVVLRVEPQASQIAGAPPMVAVPLPDGSQARLSVEREPQESGGGRDGEGAAAITLSWQSDALGTMALRLTVAPGALRALVEVGPRGLEVARAGANDLRDALAQATNRPADVRVVERRDPVDIYA